MAPDSASTLSWFLGLLAAGVLLSAAGSVVIANGRQDRRAADFTSLS